MKFTAVFQFLSKPGRVHDDNMLKVTTTHSCTQHVFHGCQSFHGRQFFLATRSSVFLVTHIIAQRFHRRQRVADFLGHLASVTTVLRRIRQVRRGGAFCALSLAFSCIYGDLRRSDGCFQVGGCPLVAVCGEEGGHGFSPVACFHSGSARGSFRRVSPIFGIPRRGMRSCLRALIGEVFRGRNVEDIFRFISQVVRTCKFECTTRSFRRCDLHNVNPTSFPAARSCPHVHCDVRAGESGGRRCSFGSG